MEHRIQLSTQLLITIKTVRRTKSIAQARISGRKIDVNPASLQEKSRHLVDVLGNIIPAGSKEIIAA